MAGELKGACIAFDLDGTLVDTAPDLVRALNAAVTPVGLAPVPLNAVRGMIGRGARALIEAAYARESRSLEPDALEARMDVFMDTYRAGLADESRPFPHVVETLDSLLATGARLSVCTNKTTKLAAPLLEALGLASRFERIIGADLAPEKKPHPSHLIEAFGGEPDGFCALVGDSAPDVGAAKAAGAFAAVYIHGYSEKPADALGADRLFSCFSELPPILEEAASAR